MKINKMLLFLVSAAALQIIRLSPIPTVASQNEYTIGTYEASDISLSPGTDASELNFAWITETVRAEKCAVQIAPKNMGFKKSKIFTGTKNRTDDSVTDLYNCKVTVAGLESRTAYIYRLGDNRGNWSETYEYSTEDTNRYGFIYLSDVQIGAGKQGIDQDIGRWTDMIRLINDHFPEAAFIMSAGDQVETSGNEQQWAGFFSPEALRSIPVAPAASNQDRFMYGVFSEAFNNHFNLPNESAYFIEPGYADVKLAGDYYFTYGDVLFIVLDTDSKDYERHEIFMEAAILDNPYVKWKVAMWHDSLYSATLDNPSIDQTEMTSIMEDMEIDVVLTGHEHTYCRTYPMFGDTVQEETFNNGGDSVNPSGIVYFTANAACGDKYYGPDSDVAVRDYVSAYARPAVPMFSYVEVDAHRMKISTYKVVTPDAIETIDTYSILKVDN